jgi:uncharacterized membrane protein
MSDTLRGWSLVTVHPVLVHLTVGTMPLVVLAYAVAAWRRSERWTFAADVALVVTAVATLATFAFGLVSNAALSWPGGLGTWRWLHLGFGCGSTALLLGLAVVRLVSRRRRPVSGLGSFAAVGLVALVIGFTGWIGGEVLVYRSGMAVDAAGAGALAPPITAVAPQPHDLMDAMHVLRADWGAATATLASTVVEHPTPARFSTLADDASGLRKAAAWLARSKPELAAPAQELAHQADALAEAARQHDPARAASAMGQITQVCVQCHEQHRWSEGNTPSAQRSQGGDGRTAAANP